VAELGGLHSHPAATLGLIAALVTLPCLSRGSTGSAEKAYHKGDFKAAAADYAASLKKEPDNAQLQFNTGAAAYKAGEFDSAQTAFERALTTTDLPVQQSAYYNLGNAQYRLGQNAESTDPEETIKNWEAAVKSYEASLQLKPDDADAEYNRDLVKRKLDELKQQQQQQTQQQDQQKNQNQDQNQDQQSNNRSGQDENNRAEQQQTESQTQQAKNSSGADQQNQPQEQNQDQQPNQQAGQHEQPREQAQSSSADLNQEAQSGQTPQQANAEEQGRPAQGASEASEKAEQQRDDSMVRAGERRTPGQMTTEEAERLLDSLKGDDQTVAAAPLSRGQMPPQQNQPLKDW
jgi:Ca-activated chloride channel family protein